MSKGSRLAVSLTIALVGMSIFCAELRAATVKVYVYDLTNTLIPANDISVLASFIDANGPELKSTAHLAGYPYTITLTPYAPDPRLTLTITRISTGVVTTIPSINTYFAQTLYVIVPAPTYALMGDKHEYCGEVCPTAQHETSYPVMAQPAYTECCQAPACVPCCTHSCRKSSRRCR